MSGPWERYGAQPAAPADGPWSRYAGAAAAEPAPQPPAAPEGGGAMEFADQAVRGVYRGVNGLLSIPGAIVGAGADLISPGSGDQFRWKDWVKPPTEYASGPVEPTSTAGRYGNAIGQAVGASAVPFAGVAGIAGRSVQAAAPASTTMGQLGQNIVNTYRASPGTAAAYDVAASVGSGTGSQLAEDLDTGAGGKMVGGLAGALALPMAASGAARAVDAISRSPTVARMRPGAAVPDEAMPQSAGAAANPNAPVPPSPPMSGADAAAVQHLANKLTSAGVQRGQLGQRLDLADDAAIGGPSRMALVDLDPSLQRLAGSVVRQSDEAANRGQRFMAGRQTGITPADGMPQGSGIPTRGFMEAPAPSAPPMGQYERMSDNVRASLGVPPRSAYRTEQDIINTARQEAKRLYGDAYQAASGVDIRPAIEPVLQQWAARAADEPREISRAITQAINLFRAPSGTVGTLQRFQRSKEFLDGKIENLMESLAGRNRALGGTLGDLQRELLGAVDNIPNVGQLYSGARGAFGTRQQMREALDLGRSAMREGAEVSADAYRALTPGQQRMFRIGLADAVEQQMKGQKRGADVTQLFQTPKMQELLTEIVPQDQAQRLGRNIQTENTMTRSNNEVFGNSKTQQRQADDEAFNQMAGVIETLRTTRSVTDAAFRATQAVLNKVFGFRADTSAAMAKRLFTADRDQLDTVIAQIEARLGPTRAAQFRNYMQEYQARVVQTAATNVNNAVQPQQRERGQRQPTPPNPPQSMRTRPTPP